MRGTLKGIAMFFGKKPKKKETVIVDGHECEAEECGGQLIRIVDGPGGEQSILLPCGNCDAMLGFSIRELLRGIKANAPEVFREVATEPEICLDLSRLDKLRDS